MKCPKCDGTLKYVEEVVGSFVCPIDDGGAVDFNNKDYYGDSECHVECSSCGASFDFNWDDNGEEIITIVEEDD